MKANSKLGMRLLQAVTLVAIVGCGGSPAIVPAVAPGYGFGGGYNGTCSGAVGGGQPISQSALNSTLTDGSGTVVGSITLYLYFSGQYSATDAYPTIVGSGSIAFTNASYLYGNYANYGGTTQQTSFCISTQDPTGGGQLTGVYAPQDQSIAIAMKGLTNLPSVNPYTGYPSGGGSQQSVSISIGYDCAAQLSGNTRFQGCVRLDMGNGQGSILWAN